MALPEDFLPVAAAVAVSVAGSVLAPGAHRSERMGSVAPSSGGGVARRTVMAADAWHGQTAMDRPRLTTHDAQLHTMKS